MKNLFAVKRFAFIAATCIITPTAFTILLPSLALEFKAYGYATEVISIIFAGPVFVYGSMCFIVPMLTSKIPKRVVITIGILMFSLSLFFVSRSYPLPNSAVCIIIGLLITGVAMPLIAIPVLPEMI